MTSYQKYLDLRNCRGLTDYKISKMTNIPKSTFSEWKSGRSKPKVDKLKKIADYFGVPLEALLEEEGGKKK